MTFEDQWIAGELHYPRIPPELWRDRLRMARAMGLDAISAYVFWNVHERSPGAFDFSGACDVAAFVRLAQAEGLGVVLRPGPYVCAEWDFGGLPWWLLKDGPIAVRATREPFFGYARRWIARLGEELAPLQRAFGGPIFAVQLENEYGAFGSDKTYLRALADVLRDAGFSHSPFFTIDQPGDLANGSLEELPVAVTFAPGDPGAQFEQAARLRPQARRICGEYWAGWFDHWGEPHARLDDGQQVRDLEWMLANGAAVNIYMFHGGTNAEFWNGANSFEPHEFQPTVTSYDYQAALDESGRPTPKFFAFRDVIATHRGTSAPAVPQVAAPIAIEPFVLDRVWPLDAFARDMQFFEDAPTMERAGFDRGFILYRTKIDAPLRGTLQFGSVRDYAVVLLDGAVVGRLDRRRGDRALEIDVRSAPATLDIFVENGGRINYGPKFPFENKGIVGGVEIDGIPLRGFEVAAAGPGAPELGKPAAGPARAPSWFGGSFELERSGDTFFDMRAYGKGALWVNGQAAGRFWNEGPQHHLFVPAPWLRAGVNDVLVLELLEIPGPKSLRGFAGIADMC